MGCTRHGVRSGCRRSVAPPWLPTTSRCLGPTYVFVSSVKSRTALPDLCLNHPWESEGAHEKRRGGGGFEADLWSRDQSAMQLLMVVLPPEHQPRHLQRDVHYVISTGRKRLVLGHSMSFPTSCKSKKRGPSSHIVRPLLRKKAAGVGRQLCSSMVGVRALRPVNETMTGPTTLSYRRVEPRHITCYPTTARTSPCRKFHQHLRWPSFRISNGPYISGNRSFSCTKRPLGTRAITTVAACSGRLELRAPHDRLAGCAYVHPKPCRRWANSSFAQSNLAKGEAGRLLSVNNESEGFVSCLVGALTTTAGWDTMFRSRDEAEGAQASCLS